MTTTHPTRLGQLQDAVRACEAAHSRARDAFQAALTGFGPLDAHQRQLMAAYDQAAMQLGEARHQLGKARLDRGLPY